MFKKYKWNFVIVVLFTSLIGFLIFDFIFYHNMKNYFFEQTLDEMRMKTNLGVKLLENESLLSLPKDSDQLYALTYQIRTLVNSRITIIDLTGQVLTDSDVARDSVQYMENHIHRPEVQESIAKGWGQSYRYSSTVKRKLLYTAFPVEFEGKPAGFFRMAYYAQNFEESMKKIITLIVAANIIGIIILFLASLYMGSMVTTPILRIVKTAKRISKGDLTESFSIHRKDEVGMLARILNQLTERLKDQIKQISTERTKLENILTNLDIGTILIDQNMFMLHANPEMFKILKLEPVATENKKIIEVIRSEPFIAAIDRTLKKNSRETGKFIYQDKLNKKFLSYIVTPFAISDDGDLGALIQLYDITELKQLEAIRKDFVANASHELKTPLTSIVGYSETLLEGAMDDPNSRIKFIRKIREQAHRLEFLVSDLLKLSEAERDEPYELKKMQLNSLLKETKDEFKEQAGQKNIELSLDCPDAEIQVKVDREFIRSAINNIVDNAIKFTPQNGKIAIRVSDAGDDEIKIEIVDTGIGIDSKYHDRIFQRFYRVDEARSRSMGGTGLGLAIAKHIIERHGSEINIDSAIGRGSAFWFNLTKA